MYKTYYKKPPTFFGPSTLKLHYMVSEPCSQHLNCRHGRRFGEITSKIKSVEFLKKKTGRIIHFIVKRMEKFWEESKYKQRLAYKQKIN